MRNLSSISPLTAGLAQSGIAAITPEGGHVSGANLAEAQPQPNSKETGTHVPPPLPPVEAATATVEALRPSELVVETLLPAPATAPAPSQSTICPIATSSFGDIARFRLSQNLEASAPVKKLITTVQVRKPHNQEFVRASIELTFDTLTYVWKEDGKLFLVEPGLVQEFPQGLRPTSLVGTMNRQGVFFFWPVFVKQGDETWNDWHRSGHDAMLEARKHWVRVESNRSLGAYEVSIALGAGLPEPEWPELSLEELLLIAFRDYIIDSPDHIILKKLRGEA